jgi:hypothetical protein
MAFKLQTIETAPRDGTYVLLFGDSGYVTTPLRCKVCRYDAEYRPRQPWVTYSNDSFEDSGPPALYWTPLPFAVDMQDESVITNIHIQNMDVGATCESDVIHDDLSIERYRITRML